MSPLWGTVGGGGHTRAKWDPHHFTLVWTPPPTGCQCRTGVELKFLVGNNLQPPGPLPLLILPTSNGNGGPPRAPHKSFFCSSFFFWSVFLPSTLKVEKGKAKTKRDVESFQLRKSNNRVIKVLKMHPLSGGTNTPWEKEPQNRERELQRCSAYQDCWRGDDDDDNDDDDDDEDTRYF